MTCLLWSAGFIIVFLFYLSTLYGIIGFFVLIFLLYILLLRSKKAREEFKDKYKLPSSGLHETKIEKLYNDSLVYTGIHCWIFIENDTFSIASPQNIKKDNKKEVFGRLDIDVKSIDFFIRLGEFLEKVEDNTLSVPSEIYKELLRLKSSENLTKQNDEKISKEVILVYTTLETTFYAFFDYKIYNVLEKLIEEKNYFYVEKTSSKKTSGFNMPLNKSYKKKE